MVKKSVFFVMVLLLALLLTAWFGLFHLPAQVDVSTRLNKTIFQDFESLNKGVETARRQVFESPLTQLVYNKGTEVLMFMVPRYVGAFSPSSLFLLVEPNVSGFSVWTHGLFYWWEGLLVIVGLFALFNQSKYRLTGIVLLLSTILLILPTLINSGTEWYLLRSLFAYFILLIIASWGLAKVWSIKKLRVITILIYTLSVLNFSYQYFYRYSIISLDWGNFDERVLAKYLDLHQVSNSDVNATVVVSQPDYFFWS